MSRLLVLSWCFTFVFARASYTPLCTSSAQPAGDASCEDVSFLQVELEVAHKGQRLASGPILSKPGPYSQKLKNVQDTHYTGDIIVGGQTVNGIFDTGSFELVVMSSHCKVCLLAGPVYSPDQSDTFRIGNGSLHEHMYGSGLIFDKAAYDTVSVGDGKITADEQPFWMVVGHVMPIILGADFGAIVGLGKKQSVPKYINEDQVSLLEALEPQMDRFSICFGKEPLSDGWLTWNAGSPAATATSLNVVGEIHWGLDLSNVHLNNATHIPLGCEDGCGAVLDSGTSLFAAPSSVLDKLSAAIEKLDPECENIDDLPDLVFQLDGKEFSLPPVSYVGILEGPINPTLKDILAFDGTPKCQPLFIRMDGPPTQYGPLWIIGMPFFREFHTTFESIRENNAENSTDTIYTSRVAECEPVDAGTQFNQQRTERRKGNSLLRRIGASQLKLPSWLPSVKEGRFKL